MRAIHRTALKLTSSDELIAHYAAHTALAPAEIAKLVGAGIDTLYATRDAGANMHSSGAAVAIEAALTMAQHTWIPERHREPPELDPDPYLPDDPF